MNSEEIIELLKNNDSKQNVISTLTQIEDPEILQEIIRLFDDEGQALQEVLNSRADAMVASQPFPEFQTLKYKDKLYLPLAGETFTKEPIGFAIRKGDVDFLNYLDNWIIVRGLDGWLRERHSYWFTTQDWKGQVE